jgi:hypothetical protein
MVIDNKPDSLRFGQGHQNVYKGKSKILWNGLGGPVRTKWWKSFVRILFTLYRQNLGQHASHDLVDNTMISVPGKLEKMMEFFLRYHNYFLKPNCAEHLGAIFYIGRPFDKIIDPTFKIEMKTLGCPVITVGLDIDSYKLPGTTENVYLTLFHMYYVDRMMKKFQSDEYYPTTPRWKHTQPYPMSI